MQNYSMNEFCKRFHFALDMNQDLAFTITDVWLIFQFIYLLPAKAIVGILHDSALASFFEIDCSTGTGIGAAVFSFFMWLIVVSFLGAALSKSA